jgi:hypothetical protein
LIHLCVESLRIDLEKTDAVESVLLHELVKRDDLDLLAAAQLIIRRLEKGARLRELREEHHLSLRRRLKRQFVSLDAEALGVLLQLGKDSGDRLERNNLRLRERRPKPDCRLSNIGANIKDDVESLLGMD